MFECGGAGLEPATLRVPVTLIVRLCFKQGCVQGYSLRCRMLYQLSYPPMACLVLVVDGVRFELTRPKANDLQSSATRHLRRPSLNFAGGWGVNIGRD